MMSLQHRLLTDEERNTIVSFREDIDKQLDDIFDLATRQEWERMGERIGELTLFFFVLGKDLG